MLGCIKWCTYLTLVLLAIDSAAQQLEKDTAAYKKVIAGASYQKTAFYQWLWGWNCRTAWSTPVCVPILWLDSVYGGLKPYKTGGGNETRSLRLHNPAQKEYALRSIKKSRDDVVQPVFKNTFVEDIIKDGVSMSHPYGALALTGMQQQAGIYHTRPTVVYIPSQAALDTFNAKYGNDLYLFEQKPDGDWSDAGNLGNFPRFASTSDVMKKLLEKNTYKVNQLAYVKARLFDMLIADWDRHEDNWSWGATDTAGETWFDPIPRDRDQAFFTHNGMLIDRILPAAGLGFMQHFDQIVKDITIMNVEAKDMDRLFTNALTMADWVLAARSLQNALTDTVIERSVRGLPPEIFAVSGNELIKKLKARRKQIIRYAINYYLFLASEVEITGTCEREYFLVNRTPNGETMVSVFRISEAGQKAPAPYYQRKFLPQETKEIRLYGISGDDVYTVQDHAKTMRVRIIAGNGTDTISQTGNKIHVYDDPNGNYFQTTRAAMHLSSSNANHVWNYGWYNYNSRGPVPTLSYNNADRIYAGLSYRFRKFKWRREPFVTKQAVGIHYSLSQKAISAYWQALYPKIVFGWDLSLQANYDAIRWTNFYNAGNETKLATTGIDYYRLRTEEWFAAAGLSRAFGKSTVAAELYYRSVKGRNDTGRYVSKIFSVYNPTVFVTNPYAGIQFTYSYVSLNDSIVPEKGFSFIAHGALSHNFFQNEFFQSYDAKWTAYIPLTGQLSLALRVGGATVINNKVLNNAQLYEHAMIGGADWLRGYRRERFWGQTALYNNNELRYIFNLRTHIVNAHMGIIGFFDDGRVWMPNERSGKLHTAYGPGLLFAPFDKVCVTLTYGISEEMNLWQLRFDGLF